MPKPDNPLSPVSRLMRRLNDEACTEGLDMGQFVLIPNYDPAGPHQASVQFFVNPDFGAAVEEEVDPEFKALADAWEKQERDEKADKARQELEALQNDLKDPKKGLGF